MKSVIKKVVQETPDTKSFIFELEEPMNYKSSQFVMIKLDFEGVPPRAYSIACAPKPKEIQVTIRIYPDGKFTPYLNNLKEGDVVDIKGPYGKFIYEKGNTTLIGAGTGIAPLRAIMQSALRDQQEVTLFYSDKTEKDLIYKDEFEQLAKEGKVRLKLFVTREPSNKKYTIGRITKEYMSKLNPKSFFYICGRPEFVTDINEQLKEIGISEEQIKYEKF